MDYLLFCSLGVVIICIAAYYERKDIKQHKRYLNARVQNIELAYIVIQRLSRHSNYTDHNIPMTNAMLTSLLSHLAILCEVINRQIKESTIPGIPPVSIAYEGTLIPGYNGGLLVYGEHYNTLFEFIMDYGAADQETINSCIWYSTQRTTLPENDKAADINNSITIYINRYPYKIRCDSPELFHLYTELINMTLYAMVAHARRN